MPRLHWNSPAACACCAATLFALFALARLLAAGGAPGIFVLAGEDFLQPGAQQHLQATPGQGYDGQFFYGLAQEPFTRDAVAGGVRLDHPAYRQQRILYPLAAWLLSWGDAQAAAWALPAVNLLALALLAWAGGLLALRCGRHAQWGLLLALYPGFLLSFSRNLAEPLAAALLAWGLVWLLDRRRLLAALALCLAVLTRETTLLLPLGLLAALLLRRRPGELLPALAPLCVFALWQFALWHLWGQPAWEQGGGNLGWPLSGLWSGLQFWLDMPLRSRLLYGAQVLCLLLYLRAGAAGLGAWRETPALPLAWCFFLALLLCLTGAVWREGWGFMRAASEFCLLGGVLALSGGAWARRAALACAALLWLGIAAKLVLQAGGWL